MVASRVIPKILTVEIAIIVSIQTTKDGLIDSELLAEWKIINFVFCSLILREYSSQTHFFLLSRYYLQLILRYVYL